MDKVIQNFINRCYVCRNCDRLHTHMVKCERKSLEVKKAIHYVTTLK